MLRKIVIGLTLACGMILVGMPAMAVPVGPSVSIDDRVENSVSGAFSVDFGLGFHLEVAATYSEGPNATGRVDIGGLYTTAVPLPVGTAVTSKFNIFEPNSTILSDTLQLTFTGVSPTLNDFADNMLLQLTFLSDSLNGDITPLSGEVTTLFETGQFQTASEALGVIVQFASDVDATPTPEPATMLLMGMGALGMGFMKRRKAKATAC